MTGDAVEQLRHMELLESDLAQLDLPDPWWKWWNCATGWRVGGCFFFCGLRCFCLWKVRRDINGDKDAGCVFWFPRIKAFTQTKCGPISGCKFSTQKKAFPFSHPQVGHFVTALGNDEMCVFAAHLRFLLGRSAIYGSWDTNLWSLPRFVPWFDHRAKISTESTTRDLDMAAVFWSSSCPRSHSA